MDELAPRPVGAGDRQLYPFWWRQKDAQARVAEAGAEKAELANVLLRVGIGLAVVIPLFEILYGTATGSAAPFGWHLMALPGSVLTISAGSGFARRGEGHGGGAGSTGDA